MSAYQESLKNLYARRRELLPISQVKRFYVMVGLLSVAAWVCGCGRQTPQQAQPQAANLESKSYPSTAAGQNRALQLTVLGFQATPKVGGQDASAGHLWLLVNVQWSRLATWKPADGAPSAQRLDQLFLMVNGDRRVDFSPDHRPADQFDIPAPGAALATDQYFFQIPNHDVRSIELVSFDQDLGTIRLLLFGTPPTAVTPPAKPVAWGGIELTVVGAREEDTIGGDYSGPQSRYVVVELRVRNPSQGKPVTLNPFDSSAAWMVADSAGDRYPISPLDGLEGRFNSPTVLLPGLTQSGFVAFSVPVQHYALTLTAAAADGPQLAAAIPGTGPEVQPAGNPQFQFKDGNTLTVSVLSVGRTGTLGPDLQPSNGVASGEDSDAPTPRYLILETLLESSSDAELRVDPNQFQVVQGSQSLGTDSADLDALPSRLGHSDNAVVPPHGTRRMEFVFVLPADWRGDAVIRYRGGAGNVDFPLPASKTSAPALAQANAAVNVADADIGGQIEYVSGAYGSGFTGRDLLRGSSARTWTPEEGAHFPFDIVASFYRRSSAKISAVEFRLPQDPRSAPRAIEIWTSTTSATSGFAKIAAATLNSQQQIQSVAFAPIDARFVKLHILSGNGGPFALELAGIRILEATAAGYEPLTKRFPEAIDWPISARRAAQIGIDWLEPATIHWQRGHRCFGCHVQAQTAMGLLVARRNDYVVSDALIDQVIDFTVAQQLSVGADRGAVSVPDAGAIILPTIFAAMSYSYMDKGASAAADTALQSAAAWLLAKQASTGEVARGDYSDSPPIVQGSIVTTANAAFAFAQAFAASHDPRFQSATDRAMAFIAAAPVQTTQDKVFKILALARLGGPTQRPLMAQLVAQLQSEQDASGGWKESADLDGPNAFATGQVLYAFKQAEVSLDSPSFSHGVDYLLRNQKSTGAWESGATQSPSHTEFAPTMWAIIGLAGSFSAKRSDGEPPPTLERRFKTAIDSTGKLVLHVNFDFDKATLRPDAAPILDQVAALMRDHADWRFEIDGYTDNVGTDPHNQTLSEARARSVMNALIERRIDAQRMSSAGFGKGAPVATNDTEEGRYANRRVELVRQ